VDFEIEHAVTGKPAHVAEVLLDHEYQASLGDHLGPLSHREVLEQTEMDDGRVVRHIRCVLDIDIDGPARRFIGSSDPAWVEEAIWYPDKHVWEWKILPEVAKELLAASGTIELHPKGAKTLRVVTGEVKVRVPLYGGKVEGWIVDGLERAYADEADHLEAWLRQRP
jgi:hypothetical protein